MKNITKVCLTMIWWWSIIKAEELLKTCTIENLLVCPTNAVCVKLPNYNDTKELKCLCIDGYQLNSIWHGYDNLNNSLITLDHYCLPINHTTMAPTTEVNKLIVYLRSPARREHLVFGILLVLLAAGLATGLLFGLKVLKPIKRSKAVYKRLKYKRQYITPLQELDELELNRHYEMQTL
ncbi:hypothetical protein DOY81_001095 [Sarcophaga bullata]|nr:hypothetical protein DOY81_001095 [Sarcophaga bullata]